MLHDAFVSSDLVASEIRQRRESGFDVDDIQRRFEALPGDASGEMVALLDELDSAPARIDWPYEEPTDWDALVQTLSLPKPTRVSSFFMTRSSVRGRGGS